MIVVINYVFYRANNNNIIIASKKPKMEPVKIGDIVSFAKIPKTANNKKQQKMHKIIKIRKDLL